MKGFSYPQRYGLQETRCIGFSGLVGYANANFCSSEAIIVVGQNEKNCKFTLTANWKNGGTVTIDYYDYQVYNSAQVDFDSNEWDTSTKMTVIPRYPGVTRATFTSTVDRMRLNVVIVVRDNHRSH